MDFRFDEEQQDLKTSVEGFARRELAPHALRRAHEAGYSWDLSRLIAKQGLLGLTIPADKGGQGGTLMDAVIAIEAVASSCPKSADIVQAGNFGAVRTFAEYASDELRHRLLPGFLSGERLLGLGMTEPEAGSAVTELTTSARRHGDEYVVNGTKIFSTHSPDATHYLVYVRFGPGLGGIGSIVIDRRAPGLSVGSPSAFMSGEEWSQALLRELPRPSVGPAPWPRRVQEADFRVQRRADRQRRAVARTGPLRLQPGPRTCQVAPPVWSSVDGVPRPTVDVRRHGRRVGERAAPPLQGSSKCRLRSAVGL